MLATVHSVPDVYEPNFFQNFSECHSIESLMNLAVNKRFGGAVRWRVQPPIQPAAADLCVLPGAVLSPELRSPGVNMPPKRRASKKHAA